ncbi:hypothetical protein ONZ45_g5998 [Pleurotus djamor]|nr:hypothetical protein ONZ45_g5998 [Pleurotus djamor]
MQIPNSKFDGLNEQHLRSKISSIGLVAHFSAQGVCDERWHLATPRTTKNNPKPRPHRSNHFSLWFFLEGGKKGEAVMIDIVAESYLDNDPWFTKLEDTISAPASGVVRARSEALYTRQDVGCVMEEYGVVKNLTPYDIINLIKAKGLNEYLHPPDARSRVGCRHWLRVLSSEIEIMGWVTSGFGKAVEENVLKFFDRLRSPTKGGIGGLLDGWEYTPSEDWDYLPRGVFVGSESAVRVLARASWMTY